MLFYYIRHGDPIYDPDSLTPLGHRQAEAVARRLALHGIDKIFASTSTRARQTAAPTAEILKKEVSLVDFANESHAWRELTVITPTGRRWLFHNTEMKEFFHSEEIRSLGFEWYKHPAFAEYDYKSGIDRIQRASDEFFSSLGYRHLGYGRYEVTKGTNERVAMFAHQGFGLAFLSCIVGIPYPLFSTHFDSCHSGVTVINFEDEGGFAYPKILTLSNDSHIYEDGLPTKYSNGIYI